MAQLTQNLFGSSLTEIQDKARAAQGKRRREAGLLGRQNSNRPGIDQALSNIGFQIGSSMFGGGKGSEADMAKATEGEKETARIRAMDEEETEYSAMVTAQEMMKAGLTKEAARWVGIAKVRASLNPKPKYETWYNADGSSQKIAEINGIPMIDGKKVDPTKMHNLGLFTEKPDKEDQAVFGMAYKPEVTVSGNQLSTLREQLIKEPIFSDPWYSRLDDDQKKVIGNSLAGRVEGVVKALKYEEYQRVTAAADAGEMTKVQARRIMNQPDSYWIGEGLKLYIEGGGINFDVTDGKVDVNQSQLTLQGLRNNQQAAADDRKFRAESDEKYGAGVIGTDEQYRVEQLSFDQGAQLFTALANGSITPEQSIQAQEDAMDGETFSPEMKNYQLIVRQGMADNPRLVTTFFSEPDNRKRANLMEKYIDELQQTNIQKFHEQKQLLIHLARVKKTTYNSHQYDQQHKSTSTSANDTENALNTASKQVNYDTPGANMLRNSMGRYN